MSIGALRDRLTFWENSPAIWRVSLLLRANTTATATTSDAHGFTTGDYVMMAGADPTAYNGKVKITVTGLTTFTYTVSGSPQSPATGAISARYISNAQGGQVLGWREKATVWAESVPIRSWEQLQLTTIQTATTFRFRMWARADITAQMQLTWTPAWPTGGQTETLRITGITPDPKTRVYQLIDAVRVPR